MKTIWIIDHYSSEPKYGGIQRQFDFANELSKRGYRTVIISSSFSHYTHTYITEDICHISQFAENAYYAYVHTSSYTSNGGIGRIKNMFSLKRKWVIICVRAPVAQWIMQQISNLWIAGSSPAGRAIDSKTVAIATVFILRK